MKTCSKCRIEKPREMFSRCASRPDGLQAQCKACKRAYHVASYTPEKGRAGYEKKKTTNPERYRAQAAAAARKWRAANPDRAKEIARKAATKQLALRSDELNARRREKRKSAPAFDRDMKRRSYLKHRGVRLAEQKVYRDANKEQRAKVQRAWRVANSERKRLKNRAHYEANKERWRAYGAARKAAKLRATPKWAELAAIRAFYMAAPEGFDVDHIVPLQGKTVCGLHCLANLQYLKHRDNCSKRHHWWPDMPEEQRRAA